MQYYDDYLKENPNSTFNEFKNWAVKKGLKLRPDTTQQKDPIIIMKNESTPFKEPVKFNQSIPFNQTIGNNQTGETEGFFDVVKRKSKQYYKASA